MKTCCTVVIGHVDHGKTALVRALTGVETDRLPEEKARRLSILPGFAHHTYPSGTIDFIDAPGHADFVQAMVTGAAGARAALVVISLTEGPGAQTHEHLRIADLLGIKRAVIALTKSDGLPTGDVAARIDEIRAGIARTAFADAPLFPCSAQTGAGIADLHEALERLLETDSSQTRPAFLPIDRVFTVSGRGTIVTGTLQGAGLTLDTPLTLHPKGQKVSIRGLQSRGAEMTQTQPGTRVAVNLRGVNTGEVTRGDVLCAEGLYRPSQCLDVAITPDALASVKHMQEVRVLLGTSSAVAQMRLFKQTPFAQLRFQKPVVCHAGQRAILRRLSPPETLGGAEVLDPVAQPTRTSDANRISVLFAARDGDAARVAQALCNEAGGIAQLDDIARLARTMRQGLEIMKAGQFVQLDQDWITPKAAYDAGKHALLERLSTYHKQHPLRRWAPHKAVRMKAYATPLITSIENALVNDGALRRDDNRLALANHDPMAQLSATQENRLAQIEASYAAAGLAPPKPAAKEHDDPDLHQLLIDSARLIPLHNVALNQVLTFHKNTISDAAKSLASAFPSNAHFTASQARTALGTSRRVIVPLLEYFDTIEITQRNGDLRQMRDTISVPHQQPQD